MTILIPIAIVGVVATAIGYYFATRTPNGSCVVYKANGYTPVRVSTHAVEEATDDMNVIWRVIVFRDDDGRIAAEFTSSDYKTAGMANYSSTVVGALAELCATLIKMDEDDASARIASQREDL